MKQTFETKHELQLTEDGTAILLRNGAPCICPWQNSHLLPGQFEGSVSINPQTCNSRCSLFMATANTLQLHCAGENLFITLQGVLAPAPAPGAKIVKL